MPTYINYSDSVFLNMTGPIDAFTRLNFASYGFVGMSLVVCLFIATLYMMHRRQYSFDKCMAGAAFVGFFSSLTMRIFGEFGGVPFVPDWFVIGSLTVTGIMIGVIFWRNRSNN